MEATHGSDQVEEAHFVAQMGLNVLPYENHSHGGDRTGGQLAIQSAAVDRGHRTKRRKKCPYPSCPTVKGFGRDQEVKRHVRDKHMPQSVCPFCNFPWTRPDKIKDHIIFNHAYMFTVEFLVKFMAFSGKQVSEFLGADDYGPHVEKLLRSLGAS